jgi:RNA polymerase primary sigma factor
MVADEGTRSPADVLLENRRSEAVMKLLAAIDDRAAEILRYRFGLEGHAPLTLKEIGDRVGLTRERVRQIERDTLRCIMEAIHSQEEDTRAPVAQRVS